MSYTFKSSESIFVFPVLGQIMKFKFVLIYLVSTIFFGIPIVLNLIILKNSGELDSVETVVEKQISENTLYGSGTNQNTFFYKLELLKVTKPNIVALGSSRVMQFRKEMFNTSFCNTGGAINSVDEAEKFVNEMLKWHKPKIVIFGLDDWWFNPNSPAASWKNPEIDSSSLITFEKIVAPFVWQYEKKITFYDYAMLLVSDKEIFKSKLTTSKLLGISAIKKETGFRGDGSYFYGNMMVTKNNNDYLFRDTLRRINNGVDRFEYANNVSTDNWMKMMSIIHVLESNGVTVIAFIPPLSKSAYSKINSTAKYGYIVELSNMSMKDGIADFRDPSELNLSDCDFTDGFHGGEMAYLNILYNLKAIRPFLNYALFEKEYLDNYSHYLNIPIQVTDIYKESDILGIGCNRNKTINCLKKVYNVRKH